MASSFCSQSWPRASDGMWVEVWVELVNTYSKQKVIIVSGRIVSGRCITRGVNFWWLGAESGI